MSTRGSRHWLADAMGMDKQGEPQRQAVDSSPDGGPTTRWLREGGCLQGWEEGMLQLATHRLSRHRHRASVLQLRWLDASAEATAGYSSTCLCPVVQHVGMQQQQAAASARSAPHLLGMT